MSWALVLGPTAGTGRAIARAVMRERGMDLFGLHRGHYPEEAAALIAEAHVAGRRCVLRVGEAGTAEGVAAGIEGLQATAGARSVGFFVHSLANASIGRFTDGEDRLTPRQMEKTFASMAHSFVWWIQALADADLLAPGARLLALTNPLDESLLGHCGLVAASKAALEQYVKQLAFELGPRGFRVNLLKFATVITPAVAKVYGAEELARVEALHRQFTPARRMCTTDEVGRFAALLLDERAEWLNGATIDFSGAMTQSLLDFALVRR